MPKVERPLLYRDPTKIRTLARFLAPRQNDNLRSQPGAIVSRCAIVRSSAIHIFTDSLLSPRAFSVRFFNPRFSHVDPEQLVSFVRVTFSITCCNIRGRKKKKRASRFNFIQRFSRLFSFHDPIAVLNLHRGRCTLYVWDKTSQLANSRRFSVIYEAIISGEYRENLSDDSRRGRFSSGCLFVSTG